MSNTTTANGTPQVEVSVVHLPNTTYPNNLKVRDVYNNEGVITARPGTNDLSLFKSLRKEQKLTIELDPATQQYRIAKVHQPPATPVVESTSSVSVEYLDRVIVNQLLVYKRIQLHAERLGLELPPEVISSRTTATLLSFAKADAVFIEDAPEVSQ